MTVCHVYDFVIEVANEVSDLVFTFSVLYSSTHGNDQLLFWLSVGFLAATLLMRRCRFPESPTLECLPGGAHACQAF